MGNRKRNSLWCDEMARRWENMDIALPKKIAFLLPDMGGGGAERLTVDLVNGLLEKGVAVDLVLAQVTGAFLPLVSAQANIIDLAAPRMRNIAGPLRRYVRQQRPDAMLVSMWPLTTIAVFSFFGMQTKPRLVLADHCALRSQYRRRYATLAALHATMPISYRRADHVVAVSHGLASEIAAIALLPEDAVTTIHNPVGPPLRSENDTVADWGVAPGKRILAVGSFKAQKNFSGLIDAFAHLRKEMDATLTIVGEGPLRPQLVAQISRLGLSNRVLLPGFTATPGDWYATADAFVLSSDYEGFGNVIVEAMHCGLPVVATDCPYGPTEVLGQGRWGALVPVGDTLALAAALKKTLESPVDPSVQRARAAEFSIDRAVNHYARLLLA